MLTFLSEFMFGEPVAVLDAKGDLFGIPCGFVMFDDGVSWSDDGVLQPYCSHHPTHHLYGKVDWVEGRIHCDGLTFAPGTLHDPKFGNAWASLNRNKWQWQSVHKAQNYKLRSERLMRDDPPI